MAHLWLTPLAFIQERPFDVHVPAYYYPNLPDAIKHPQPFKRERPSPGRRVAVHQRPSIPLYAPHDPGRMQKASFSCQIMIEMFVKQVEFELAHEEDTVEIIDGLDRYLESLRRDIELGDETCTTYAQYVINWRKEVYKHFYRVMMTNPAAREKLYPNGSPNKNLLSIIARVNSFDTTVAKLEPLVAMAHPPYEIDQIKPNTQRESVVSGSTTMEGSLGLPTERSYSVLEDTGKDFNIKDFLNR